MKNPEGLVFVALALVAVLSACRSPDEYRQAKCGERGFAPNTLAFVECQQQLKAEGEAKALMLMRFGAEILNQQQRSYEQQLLFGQQQQQQLMFDLQQRLYNQQLLQQLAQPPKPLYSYGPNIQPQVSHVPKSSYFFNRQVSPILQGPSPGYVSRPAYVPNLNYVPSPISPLGSFSAPSPTYTPAPAYGLYPTQNCVALLSGPICY